MGRKVVIVTALEKLLFSSVYDVIRRMDQCMPGFLAYTYSPTYESLYSFACVRQQANKTKEKEKWWLVRPDGAGQWVTRHLSQNVTGHALCAPWA